MVVGRRGAGGCAAGSACYRSGRHDRRRDWWRWTFVPGRRAGAGRGRARGRLLGRDVTSVRAGLAAGSVGLPERCDAVVVGGGVLGLASAYELACRNLSVVVVEGGRVGGWQSGRNLGFVRQQGRALAELPMMMAASRRWRGLGGELGSDVEWPTGGNLRLTNDPELAGRFERGGGDAASLGGGSPGVGPAEGGSVLPRGGAAVRARGFTPVH